MEEANRWNKKDREAVTRFLESPPPKATLVLTAEELTKAETKNWSAAVAVVPSGATVAIVAGDYPAALGNTFVAGADGRAMTLTAHVGFVRIGN